MWSPNINGSLKNRITYINIDTWRKENNTGEVIALNFLKQYSYPKFNGKKYFEARFSVSHFKDNHSFCVGRFQNY